MEQITCKFCGKKYEKELDGTTKKTCPRCLGMGLKESECTCRCVVLRSGITLNIPWIKNKECPIHGTKIYYLQCGCGQTGAGIVMGFLTKINPKCLKHGNRKGTNK